MNHPLARSPFATALLVLVPALVPACSPRPSVDPPPSADPGVVPEDDAATSDGALLRGGPPSSAPDRDARSSGGPDTRAERDAPAAADAAIDISREGGTDARAVPGEDPRPDSAALGDAAAPALDGNAPSTGEGAPPRDVDVPPSWLSCAAARLCWHQPAASTDDCIARTEPASRASAAALRACEHALCAEGCDAAGPISAPCNDCALRLCRTALESCARSSGCGDRALASDIEQCDDGNDDPSDGCTNACTLAHCGDSIVERGEECDDSNADERDDCLSDCRRAACGDGWVRLGVEACDDGNADAGDGCSPTCMREGCGNAIVDPGEECDDGDANGDDRPCLATCAVNRCGDGKRCDDSDAGCGSRFGTLLEACDDANRNDGDACSASCQPARCGDRIVQAGVEACDDGNDDPFDGCSPDCRLAAGHLLITEIVARPAGAEMIEIYNPTDAAVALTDYAISDSADYYETAAGAFAVAPADFAARFPALSSIGPREYRTIAIGNASGGTASFAATYGKPPDFELLATAHDAPDDPDVADMESAQSGKSTIGSSASLTDGGEPVVLFRLGPSPLVADVDYVFYGSPSSSNPAVDKTGAGAAASSYLPDTPGGSQATAHLAAGASGVHRCDYSERGERNAGGNGLLGHDETSEPFDRTFVSSIADGDRTPGGPPPAALCRGVPPAAAP